MFRLEIHDKNLATKVLSLWRKTVKELWEYIYDVDVIGFETFVIENDIRKGTLYKADNWTFVGETSGSTKVHNGLKNKSSRTIVEKKLIYCKWIKNKKIIPKKKYISSWKMETQEQRDRAKLICKKKNNILGMKFYY